MLIKIPKKEFTKPLTASLDNKKVLAPLGKLYTQLLAFDKQCGALERITSILQHFDDLTDHVESSLSDFVCYKRF